MPINGLNNNAPVNRGIPVQNDNPVEVARRDVNGNAGTNPILANLRNVRGPREVPRMNFASRLFANAVRVGSFAVKYLVDKFCAAFKIARGAEKPFFESTLTFSVPGHEQPIEWSAGIFKDMLFSVSAYERPEAMRTLQSRIQARIENGAAIYAELKDPNVTNLTVENPSYRAVSDFTLFLYAKAAAQGDSFMEGAFNIADPNGRIAHWLESSRDNYLRSSSHMTEIQGEMVIGKDGHAHKNVQRGIDIPPSIESGLPSIFKTVCYGTITPLTGDRQANRRLFLKAESFGCRISTRSLPWHSNDNLGVAPRSWRLRDIWQCIGHSLSFITTRGQNGNLSCRKEHTPDSVKDMLKKWRKADLSQMSPRVREFCEMILDCRCEEKGIGVRKLVATLNQVDLAMRDYKAGLPDGKLPESDNAFIAFHNDICAVLSGFKNDNLDVRLGNEVIIN